MSRIITRMTRGRINTGTKKVLVLAVAGALFFTGSTTPIPTPTPTPIYTNFSTGGYTKKKYTQKQLDQEDDLIFNIIKIWVQCQ